MSVTITLPERYPLVLAAGVATYWVSMWQALQVGRYRGKAGIAYPQAYADKAQADASVDAMKFNCIHRAQQNTVENIPHFLFGLLVTGLRYPTVAAALGFAYSFGRIMYTLGYASGNPDKRFSKGGYLALVPNTLMWLASTWTIVEFLREYMNN
ncbi:membrane-associated proteins in eicosanoid and glutathione metabolism [Rickenella mellea]|uniref:Membrane-associated proteins in eicosanoid and glutathione metabolism n=1 Tax=Rickenella mellea TaxID=50990 RepID=A0A4R5XDT9_9AGAM|nr:membrane-associated proteins in eicosanoid and glutathione metabolism [Rickenella mellea]